MRRLAFTLAILTPALARADGLAVGVHATSLSLRDQGAPDPVHYGGGGLVVGYRFGPRWELELTTDHLEDHQTGATPIDGGALAARFHLTPSSRWDFSLLAGAGGVKEADRQSGLGELGAGVERRFGRLGVAADLRAIAIGEPKGAPTAAAMSTAPTAPTSPSPKRGGGQLDLAVTYHF